MQDLEQKIKSLAARGNGRKSIANFLGITEYQVRKVLKAKTSQRQPKKKRAFKRKPLEQMTHAFLVVDGSGSMSGLRNAALKALNTTIYSIKENAKKTKQKTTISLLWFGVGAGGIRPEFFRVPSDEVGVVLYYPTEGMTPLYDGIGEAITQLKTIGDSPNVSYLVITITDGHENNSYRYVRSIHEMMHNCQVTDRWTFAFQVPVGQKEAVARELKIPSGNITEWEQTTEGVANVTVQTVVGVSSYFKGRSAGESSTKKFFVEAGDLSKTEVKQALTDIRSKVKVLQVKREVEIRSFVEHCLGNYEKGSAYYQLTKPEKVQSYKNILLMRKRDKAIYGGVQAKSLLNFPPGDVKVVPGNHGDWDIFVQSTSVNRKLVRGTQLLVVNL